MSDDKPSRRHGGILRGCLTLLIVPVAGALMAYYGLRHAIHSLDTKPAVFPRAQISPEELTQLQSKVAAFTQALEKEAPTQPLVLSSQDINALIDSSVNPAQIKGSLSVGLEADHIKAQLSLPLDNPQLPSLNGRYLNGEIDLKASIENGELSLNLQSLRLEGRKIPDWIMSRVGRVNLAKYVKNKNGSDMIHKLQSLEIKEGKITLTGKPPR